MTLSSMIPCLVFLAFCATSVTSESYTASIGGYSATESTIGINTVKKFSISDTSSQGYLYEVPSNPKAALKLKVTAQGSAVTACYATDASIESGASADASYSYSDYDESEYDESEDDESSTSSSSTSASVSADGGADDSDASGDCLTVKAGSSGTATIPLSMLKGAKVLAISLLLPDEETGDDSDSGESATGTLELIGPGLSPQQLALVVGLCVGVGGLLLIGGGIALCVMSRKRRASRNVAKVQGGQVITPGQQFGQVQGYPGQYPQAR